MATFKLSAAQQKVYDKGAAKYTTPAPAPAVKVTAPTPAAKTSSSSSGSGGNSSSSNSGSNIAAQNQVLTQGQSYAGGTVNYDRDTGEKLAPGATTNSLAGQKAAITTPTPPVNPAAVNTEDLAGQYKALLSNTAEETAAQKAIDDQNNAYRTGVHNVEDQPIGMSFISGQTASLENRNTDLQIPLAQKLALAQEKRRASLDAVKFGLERADKATAAEETKRHNIATEGKESISDQYGTGAIGEYNFAKANGYTGSFTQYQNEDANRKAKASGSGLLGGLTAAQINSTVNGIANSFDNEPIVKNFNVLKEGYQFAKGLSNETKNPADDQGLVYAFAKAMDPGSVVREGEYATVQKYAQSLVQSYGKSVTQALNGTGFLSADARANIKKTIESKYNTSKSQYDNVYSSYQKRIADAKSGKGNSLTDYGNTGNSSQPKQMTLNGKLLTLQADGTYK